MPHGGYHGTVVSGASQIDGQDNPNQQTIQTSYKIKRVFIKLRVE